MRQLVRRIGSVMRGILIVKFGFFCSLHGTDADAHVTKPGLFSPCFESRKGLFFDSSFTGSAGNKTLYNAVWLRVDIF